jgi:hypothetical protein
LDGTRRCSSARWVTTKPAGSSWQQLAADLRSLASLPAEPLESTEYGTKYAIIGPLTGLNERVAEIVTVWIILTGEDVPRFVTAYPKD